uniref:Uncharacterized protein n=1 Tax=Arundo donax TaxID=35708 RepID=A0A0A9B9G5_ARUDO
MSRAQIVRALSALQLSNVVCVGKISPFHLLSRGTPRTLKAH